LSYLYERVLHLVVQISTIVQITIILVARIARARIQMVVFNANASLTVKETAKVREDVMNT
jgi:hypothetical protein